MCELKIAGIVNDSITDGPGIRFAIFVQGCPHHCEGCHNPHTWDFAVGESITSEEILGKIKKNPLLSGVTFSGGEPFCQAKALSRLACEIKKLDLEIAVYTGYTIEEILQKNDADEMELLRNIDTLIDGRFVLEKRNIDNKFKGSDNQRVIDVKKTLEQSEVILNTSQRWN